MASHNSREIQYFADLRDGSESYRNFVSVCNAVGALTADDRVDWAKTCDKIVDKRNTVTHSANVDILDSKVAAVRSLVDSDASLVVGLDAEYEIIQNYEVFKDYPLRAARAGR